MERCFHSQTLWVRIAPWGHCLMKSWEGKADMKGSTSSEGWEHSWGPVRDLHLRTRCPSVCGSYALYGIIITCIARSVVGIKSHNCQKAFCKRIKILHKCHSLVMGERRWSAICLISQVQLNWRRPVSGNQVTCSESWPPQTRSWVFSLIISFISFFLFLQRTEWEPCKKALAKYPMLLGIVSFGLHALPQTFGGKIQLALNPFRLPIQV